MGDKSFRSLVLLQERVARKAREEAEYSAEKEAYHWVLELSLIHISEPTRH